MAMAISRYSRSSRAGFTLVELLVSILIFAFGFSSVYLLVDSSSRLSLNGKNMITASQLAQEQIELVKNLRDTNWLQMKYWDSLQSAREDQDNTTPARFASGYYLVENRQTGPGVWIKSVADKFSAEQEQLIGGQYDTRLCFNSTGRYTHKCTEQSISTIFTSFLQVSPLVTKDSLGGDVTVANALKVVSRVSWYDR